MKNLEKSLGFGPIKPTKEERFLMRKSFELAILDAALLKGMISPEKYEKIFKKRLETPKRF